MGSLVWPFPWIIILWPSWKSFASQVWLIVHSPFDAIQLFLAILHRQEGHLRGVRDKLFHVGRGVFSDQASLPDQGGQLFCGLRLAWDGAFHLEVVSAAADAGGMYTTHEL